MDTPVFNETDHRREKTTLICTVAVRDRCYAGYVARAMGKNISASCTMGKMLAVERCLDKVHAAHFADTTVKREDFRLFQTAPDVWELRFDDIPF